MKFRRFINVNEKQKFKILCKKCNLETSFTSFYNFKVHSVKKNLRKFICDFNIFW